MSFGLLVFWSFGNADYYLFLHQSEGEQRDKFVSASAKIDRHRRSYIWCSV